MQSQNLMAYNPFPNTTFHFRVLMFRSETANISAVCTPQHRQVTCPCHTVCAAFQSHQHQMRPWLPQRSQNSFGTERRSKQTSHPPLAGAISGWSAWIVSVSRWIPDILHTSPPGHIHILHRNSSGSRCMTTNSCVAMGGRRWSSAWVASSSQLETSHNLAKCLTDTNISLLASAYLKT